MARSLSKLFTRASAAFVAPVAIALLAPACSSDEAAPGAPTEDGGSTGGASGNTGGAKNTGGGMGQTGGGKATGGQAGSTGGSAGAGGASGGSPGTGGTSSGGTDGGTDSGNGGTPATGGTDGGSGGTPGTGGAATGGTGNGGAGGATDACAPLSLTPPTVTAPIQVPAGATVVQHFHAEGTQNYTCKGTALPDAGTSYSWGASVPEANLFQGPCQVGTHFKSTGPTWEFTADGSSVVGSKVNGENHNNTIPWLLLKAVDHTGTGVFSNITFIQRVDTTGGVSPTDPCDAGHVDVTIKVPYTAEYYFFEGGVGDGGP